MISPYMLQQLIHSSTLSENEITKLILVPCLRKLSMRGNYNLRNVQFVGGRDERGSDIEYYEVIGPDKHRLFSGIQVKKKNLSISDATELIIQGSQAFEKDIIDTATGHCHRINRWVVATTGSISSPAKEEIGNSLSRYGKLISFWDGIQLSELITENFYQESLGVLKIDPVLAGSENISANWWDPDEPQILSSGFESATWIKIPIGIAAPPTADGLFLAIRPIESNFPIVTAVVRTSIDEVVLDSVLSQVNAFYLRLSPGETEIEAMILAPSRPIAILCRGFSFSR